MNDLMERLAISKAIMNKHDGMGRGGTQISNINIPEVQDFESETPNYNIPQEYLQENTQTTSRTAKLDGTPPSQDAILKSKLPDEIKRLMIENPIAATNPLMGGGPVLSEELVEKAAKLMGTKKQVPMNEQKQIKKQPQQQNIIDNKEMRKMMKEVVQEVLKENGLILESSNSTNETMVIKVGQHIFEGKISKIKKLKS